MIGWLYALVIVIANSIGAISGMGGGVIIKPIFDTIGFNDVPTISFYSTVAVLTMAIVSTMKQLKSGISLNWLTVFWIATGSMLGGFLGNHTFLTLLKHLPSEHFVTLIQIAITIITLIFAFLYTAYDWKQYRLQQFYWYLCCGLILGFIASLLGIGGGPINVALLMLLFSMPIKDATVYSIVIILISQLTKLISIGFTEGLLHYDLKMLYYIIPAAIIGGLLGSTLSQILSPTYVTYVFQATIILVLIINIYNGFQILT